MTQRISDWGEPGHVMASDVVRQLLFGKGLQFKALAEAELKGFERPWRCTR